MERERDAKDLRIPRYSVRTHEEYSGVAFLTFYQTQGVVIEPQFQFRQAALLEFQNRKSQMAPQPEEQQRVRIAVFLVSLFYCIIISRERLQDIIMHFFF